MKMQRFSFFNTNLKTWTCSKLVSVSYKGFIICYQHSSSLGIWLHIYYMFEKMKNVSILPKVLFVCVNLFSLVY